VPRRLLQAEGAVVFATAVAVYIDADFSILALSVEIVSVSPMASKIRFSVLRVGEIWSRSMRLIAGWPPCQYTPIGYV